jgi:hypothetical protein
MLHTLDSYSNVSIGLEREIDGASLLMLLPFARPVYLLGVDISRTTEPIRILKLYKELQGVFSVALINTVQLLVHVRVSVL